MADEYSDTSMQAQLGLVSASGSMSPFGFATPPPAPFVRHPGDVSQDIVQRMMTQASMTNQTALLNRPAVMGPTSYGGGFGQQFGSNMAMMNAQMFNPFVAQAMSNVGWGGGGGGGWGGGGGGWGGGGGGGGGGGFMPGMLPSPAQMTSPSMGIFRSFPQGPMPTFPPTPPMPLVPLPPVTPTLPAPSFGTPMDYGYAQARYRGMQQTGAFVTAPGIVARAGTDILASHIGAGLGGLMGMHLGGTRGAVLGGTLGALGGLVGGEALGFGAAAERITDRFNPFRSIYHQAQQLQTSSIGHVVGGQDMELTGRGLNSGASRHLAMQLRGYSRSMPSSGEGFTNTDMIRMTQMAGETGLLNMSHSSDQIFTQMKTVAKSMKVFMKLAGEPDMREAMKSMGNLYAMGLSVPEAVQTMSNARMYSRMSGTSVRGIMEAGQTGASVFQMNGLSAGLGLNAGMGALGMAQQAVAGGAYSPALLAMQGGVQGVAQREMMAQAATLRMPMMAPAAAAFSGGGFGLNSGALSGMMTGQHNIHQMTTMGANNLINAVNKGGIGALGMFQLQQPMLQDAMGRELGPMGMKNMQFQNILQTMKMTGLSGQGGFATIASSLYGNEIATDLIAQASSPEFRKNMQRQMDVQINDLRGQAKQRVEATRRGFFERGMAGDLTGWAKAGHLALSGTPIGVAGNIVGGFQHLNKDPTFQNMTRGFYDAMETVGSWVDYADENAAEANGQQLVRTPKGLLMDSKERARASSISRSAAWKDTVAPSLSQKSPYAMQGAAIMHNARGEVLARAPDWWRTSELKDEYNSVIDGGSLLKRNYAYQYTGRKEMEEKLASAGQVGGLIAASENATAEELTTNMDKLTKLGVSAEQRGKFTSALATAAKGRGGAFLKEDINEIAKTVLGDGASQETIDLLMRTQAADAKAVAGAAGEPALTAYDPAGGRVNGLSLSQEAINSSRETLLKEFTGTDSAIMQDTVKWLANAAPDSDTATYLALMQSENGEADKFLDTLDPKKRGEVKKTGMTLLTQLKNSDMAGQKKALAEMGQTLSARSKESGIGVGDLYKAFDEQNLKFKVGSEMVTGISKLGVEKEFAAGNNDLVQAAKAIRAGQSKDKTEFKGVMSALDELDKAKTPAEKAAAQKKVEDRMADATVVAGGGTATSEIGGVIGIGEDKIKFMKDAWGKTDAQLTEIFKDGKNPLDRSALGLDYAATKLIEAAATLNRGTQ